RDFRRRPYPQRRGVQSIQRRTTSIPQGGRVTIAHVNGADLFYEVTGDGDPLVLVHGSWGDHNNWAAVVPGLAESFRVITYDRRGHSQSERPPGEGSRREDENDLGALLESLDVAPAHVGGNSFGASIVLGLA